MSDAGEKFFLGRQPILDRAQNIVGYELLFRSADTATANITDYFRAGSSVIIDALSAFGFRELLGRHKGFFNVNGDLLMSDALEILPANRIVIELLETIEVTGAVVDRCLDLKRKGFGLALDDNVYDPSFEPLYGIVDIVKIDIQQVSGTDLSEMVRLLHRHAPTLLAEKVESREQFRLCLDMGFQLFQGYFFARPTVLQKKRVDISGTALLRLMQLVLNDAEIREIEEAFKQNPGLSYHLLRLVNSVAMGMREEIRTLRHALMVLGLDQLKRWVQLALFSHGAWGGGPPLLETAAMRGRLMELLVNKQRLRPAEQDYPDRAFMTGVLSLIDVLFEVPMAEIISKLNLAEDVSRALLFREGELGGLLLLVEQLEKMDFPVVAKLLHEFRCGADLLLAAQFEAIDWTNGLTEAV